MAAFGFLPDDFDEQFSVWPCNWQAIQLFISASTQWRVSFGGAYGLDYNALNTIMNWKGIKQKKRAELLEQIRIIESEVLSIWNEKG